MKKYSSRGSSTREPQHAMGTSRRLRLCGRCGVLFDFNPSHCLAIGTLRAGVRPAQRAFRRPRRWRAAPACRADSHCCGGEIPSNSLQTSTSTDSGEGYRETCLVLPASGTETKLMCANDRQVFPFVDRIGDIHNRNPPPQRQARLHNRVSAAKFLGTHAFPM